MKKLAVFSVLVAASVVSMSSAMAGPSGDLLKNAALTAQNDSKLSLIEFNESSKITDDVFNKDSDQRITIDLNEQVPRLDGFALNGFNQ